MKLINLIGSVIMSLLGSVFINLIFFSLSSLATGPVDSIEGPHNSIPIYNSGISLAFAINYWFGLLPFIIPAAILFAFWYTYEKKRLETGTKSHMSLYTFVMFIVAASLVGVVEFKIYEAKDEYNMRWKEEIKEEIRETECSKSLSRCWGDQKYRRQYEEEARRIELECSNSPSGCGDFSADKAIREMEEAYRKIEVECAENPSHCRKI